MRELIREREAIKTTIVLAENKRLNAHTDLRSRLCSHAERNLAESLINLALSRERIPLFRDRLTRVESVIFRSTQRRIEDLRRDLTTLDSESSDLARQVDASLHAYEAQCGKSALLEAVKRIIREVSGKGPAGIIQLEKTKDQLVQDGGARLIDIKDILRLLGQNPDDPSAQQALYQLLTNDAVNPMTESDARRAVEAFRNKDLRTLEELLRKYPNNKTLAGMIEELKSRNGGTGLNSTPSSRGSTIGGDRRVGDANRGDSLSSLPPRRPGVTGVSLEEEDGWVKGDGGIDTKSVRRLEYLDEKHGHLTRETQIIRKRRSDGGEPWDEAGKDFVYTFSIDVDDSEAGVLVCELMNTARPESTGSFGIEKWELFHGDMLLQTSTDGRFTRPRNVNSLMIRVTGRTTELRSVFSVKQEIF
jgi:hypothetical protein